MSPSYRVLIVGVLDAFAAVLGRWFSEWGHEARFAEDPTAAHAAVKGWLPDLILVDHLRTPLNFEAWWNELRSQSSIAGIPAIVTGNVSVGSIQREAAATVRRPYTRHELEAVITRVMDREIGPT